MPDKQTEQVFFEIMRDCGLSQGHLLVEQEGEVRIIVNPAVRQLPDPQYSEKVGCVRQTLKQRLDRELVGNHRASGSADTDTDQAH
jgi:hypothetical protein